MFDSPYLEKTIKLSRRRGNTNYYLKKGVLHSTHRALDQVYGHNYSTKCLQSSIVIQYLLGLLSIHSEVHGGAACFGRALANEPCTLGWSGFWGENRHAWVVTEFREVIDLTVSQLHIHPKSNTEDESLPIIWYSPIDCLPMIINYLPYGIAQGELSSEEWDEIENLKSIASNLLMEYTKSPTQIVELPAPILTNSINLHKLYDQGNRWLNKCIHMQYQKTPLPDSFLLPR